MMKLTRSNKESWLATVWAALDGNTAEGNEWDEVCTAMAWIAEELGVEELTDD